MPSSNWSFYVEGIGQSHNNKADLDDANRHALDFVRALEENNRHRLFQIRFTSDRGEENWRDPATREMHEDLCSADSCGDLISPREELVEKAAKVVVKRERKATAGRKK